MNSLELLLKKWSELEPDRCRVKGNGYSVLCGGIWRTALDDFSGEPHRVKAALREACWESGMYDMVDDIYFTSVEYFQRLESNA